MTTPHTGKALPCLYTATTASTLISTRLKKQAETVTQNVRMMIEAVGIDRVGVIVLTHPDRITDRKESQKRWHSLVSNAFGGRYGEIIKVTERHQDGSLHYHVVADVRKDIRTGFDWPSYRRAQREYGWNGYCARYRKLREKYAESATPYLRSEWKWLRATLPRYGFGRCELLPVRTRPEAVGRYFAKAVLKRAPEDRGARLASYLNNSRRQSSQWAWAGPLCPSGWVRRKKIGEWMRQHGFKDFDDAKSKCGPRWFRKNSEEIMSIQLPPDTKYPSEYHRTLATTGKVDEELLEKVKRTVRG